MTREIDDLQSLSLEAAPAPAARFSTDPAILELEREAGAWHFQNLLRQAYRSS